MEAGVIWMIRRFGDRIVIEFIRDTKKAQKIIERLKERNIICLREVKKLCKEIFGRNFEFCYKTVISLMDFNRVPIDEEREVNLLLNGEFSKEYLLHLLGCGFLKNKEISPENFVKVMNYYMVKKALRNASRVEIKIGGSIASKSIKWAMYLAKKSRIFVEFYLESEGIKIASEVPKEDRIDKFSAKYRLFPEIFATILSLSNSWKMIAFYDSGYKLKLRSDSPWIADFKPPWYFKNEEISFDSEVEKIVFEALIELGYKVKREPEVVIIGNEIIIPDFSIDFSGEKIFVEVIGFWTKSYVNKKKRKIKKLKGKLIKIVDERLKEHFPDGVFYKYPPKKEEIKRILRDVIKC